MTNTNEASRKDYQSLIEAIIKKQIIILGPDIAVIKARNVKGLEVESDGRVKNLTGDTSEILRALISEYVELSGLIVKKAMEPLLNKYPSIKI